MYNLVGHRRNCRKPSSEPLVEFDRVGSGEVHPRHWVGDRRCDGSHLLNEISPVALKGSIGVLNQFSIVMGIFIAQAIGASWLGSDGTYWRIVPATSGLVSVLQLIGSFTVGVESPGWLEGEGKKVVGEAASDAADEVRAVLWSPKEVQSWKEGRASPTTSRNGGSRADEERQGLLADETNADSGASAAGASERSQAGLMDLFTDPEIRPGAILIILTQLGQQLSGIVSTPTPSHLNPAHARLTSFLLTPLPFSFPSHRTPCYTTALAS